MGANGSSDFFGGEESAWSDDSEDDALGSIQPHLMSPQKLVSLHSQMRTRKAKLGPASGDQPSFTEIIEDDDDEPEEDYRKGGYAEISAGDMLQHKYVVERKLGWGVYSTVWLADESTANRKVAIKVQKSSPEYVRAAQNEIALLRAIMAEAESHDGPGDRCLVRLLDVFELKGPNGVHSSMVFEVLGHSVLGLLQTQDRCPVPTAAYITCQILEGLSFLHTKCAVMHTDVKPENVLFVPGSSRTWPAVKIVDLGNASVVKNQIARQIQTREYRSMEAIVGSWPFACAVDVWSVAAMLFELVTGEILFDAATNTEHCKGCTKDELHLAQIIKYTGPIKSTILDKGRSSKQYVASALLARAERNFDTSALSKRLAEFVSTTEAQALAGVICQGLTHRPNERPTAKELESGLLKACPACPQIV